MKAIIGGNHSGKPVVIAVTDRRLLSAFSLLGTHEIKDIPLSRITSVNAGRDIISGTLSVDSGGDVTVFDHVDWRHIEEFASVLRQAKDALTELKGSSPRQPDVADRLLKLKQLLDAGVLTQADYDAKSQSLKQAL